MLKRDKQYVAAHNLKNALIFLIYLIDVSADTDRRKLTFCYRLK